MLCYKEDECWNYPHNYPFNYRFYQTLHLSLSTCSRDWSNTEQTNLQLWSWMGFENVQARRKRMKNKLCLLVWKSFFCLMCLCIGELVHTNTGMVNYQKELRNFSDGRRLRCIHSFLILAQFLPDMPVSVSAHWGGFSVCVHKRATFYPFNIHAVYPWVLYFS